MRMEIQIAWDKSEVLWLWKKRNSVNERKNRRNPRTLVSVGSKKKLRRENSNNNFIFLHTQCELSSSSLERAEQLNLIKKKLFDSSHDNDDVVVADDDDDSGESWECSSAAPLSVITISTGQDSEQKKGAECESSKVNLINPKRY